MSSVGCLEAVVAHECDCNGDGCRFDPHSEELIIIYLYFNFLALVTKRIAALSSISQYTMPHPLGSF